MNPKTIGKRRSIDALQVGARTGTTALNVGIEETPGFVVGMRGSTGQEYA